MHLDPLAGHPDDAVALIEPESGERVTYGVLRHTVDRLAREFAAQGAGPTAPVAMALVNGPEIVAAFLAVVRAGAAAAPLNPAYTAEEYSSYLADLEPSMLLARGEQGALARPACAAGSIPVVELAGETTAELTIGGIPSLRPIDPDEDAIALLLHTSGTTSKPKGVPLRQRNLDASIRGIAAHLALGSADVSHCVMPLFHVHGLIASTLAALQAGGTVLVPRRFSASAFWQHTATYGATWYSAVPTIHQVLVLRDRDGGERSEHRLRFARSSSSSLAPALLAELEERFGIPLIEAYGMTEASHQMASNPLPPGERRPGTVGVSAGAEIAILDDDWAVVPTGAVGEVCVRGAGVIDGYRDNPEANATAFHDGWFRTGDQGSLSADGYLTLAGRLKELINRGGEKISPHEVEDALLRHPDVREAVAFSLPDAKYGEKVAAVVVPVKGLDPEDYRTHCFDHLAPFKVPDRIVIADEIPKGPTGKIQRRFLSDEYADQE